MRFARSFLFFAGAVVLSACLPAESSSPAAITASNGAGGSGTGAATSGGGFETAAHDPLPAIAAHGVQILADVELVTITFPGYVHVEDATSFGDFVGDSAWLATVGAEYGVGKGAHLAKVVLPDAAPASIDDAGIQMLLSDRIGDSTLPLPEPPNHDVLYMLYIPTTTSIPGDASAGVFCADYVGYHGDTTIAGRHIVYAIVGDCNGSAADITSTAAHEYIEAATDPSNDGYFIDPTSQGDPWRALWGNEVADLCQGLPNVTEGGVSLQRSWSNAAALEARSSPCVPTPKGEVYFNVSVSPKAMPIVAAGESTTFTLTGWADAPVADWALSVDRASGADFAPAALFGEKALNNGKTTTLTLTVPQGMPAGSIGGVLVYSGDGYGQYVPIGLTVK